MPQSAPQGTLRLRPEDITATEPPPESDTIRLRPEDISGVEPPPFNPPPDLPPYDIWAAQREHYGRIGQGLVGAGKGLAETAYQMVRLPVVAEAKALTAIAPEGKQGPWAPIPWIAPTPEVLKPKGEAEEMGKTFERVAEYLVPSTWEAKVVGSLPKISGLTSAVLPIVVRAVNQAAGSAGVNWLQGGTAKEMELAALLGGGSAAGSDLLSGWFRGGGNVKDLTRLLGRIGEYLPMVGSTIRRIGTAGEYLKMLFPRAAKDPYALDPFVNFRQLIEKREATVPVLPMIGRAVPGLRQPKTKEPGIPEKAPARFVSSGKPTTGRVIVRHPDGRTETLNVTVDDQGRVLVGKLP
jgi:hypothetical protein